jgi:hypothetical protein
MNTLSRVTVAGLIVSVLAACSDGSLPTPSAPSGSQPPGVEPRSPVDRAGMPSNGSFTWISVSATRPLCEFITRQLGQSWSLWVKMDTTGNAVRLQLSEEPDLTEAAIFEGSRTGDAISASRKNLNMVFGCPQDPFGTPQTGGEMTARLVGQDISGTYTEVFGSSLGQVTSTFTFHASLNGSGVTAMTATAPAAR